MSDTERDDPVKVAGGWGQVYYKDRRETNETGQRADVGLGSNPTAVPQAGGGASTPTGAKRSSALPPGDFNLTTEAGVRYTKIAARLRDRGRRVDSPRQRAEFAESVRRTRIGRGVRHSTTPVIKKG